MAQIFGSDLGVGQRRRPGRGDHRRWRREHFTGTVDNIAAVVDPNTRSVAVRVVVDNPGDFLKKQMYVRVRIQARQESSGLLVPVSAILRDDENLPFVYVAQPDGSFARAARDAGLSQRRSATTSPAASRPATGSWSTARIFVQFMQNQ